MRDCEKNFCHSEKNFCRSKKGFCYREKGFCGCKFGVEVCFFDVFSQFTDSGDCWRGLGWLSRDAGRVEGVESVQRTVSNFFTVAFLEFAQSK